LRPDAPEPKVIGMKIWPTAIPQYELGHLDLMQKLEALEKDVDGLWVCGNYRTGVAFPDCVTFGYEHAKTVIDYLNEEKSGNATPITTTATASTATASKESEASNDETSNLSEEASLTA
jgi:oxygen-dependent protoporphyrinogen oxidase